MQGYHNFKFYEITDALNKKYNTSVSQSIPFTYLVPSDSIDPIPLSLAVFDKSKNPVTTKIANIEGYCMDPFNADIWRDYLQKNLEWKYGYLVTSETSFWMDNNVPLISSSNLVNNKDNNPYYKLPYVPGKADLGTNTLPEFAMHNTGN